MIRALTDLAQRALIHWELADADLHLLKFRENAVFKVTAPDRQRYVLRLHRPGYHSIAAINSELEWMAALAQAGLDVPQVVPTCSGRLYVEVSHADVAGTRVVDVLEWVADETLRDRIEQETKTNNLDPIVALIGQAGELMARLHNHTQVWKAPAGLERHAWDTVGLVGEAPFWGRFWEFEQLTPDQKRLMVAVRDRLRQDLADFPRTADTYGLIHADFNLDNLLVDGDRLRVIDFDDAGFGWHLFDIATMLVRFEGERYEAAGREAFFAGYRQHRPLSADHLAHLPLFVTARQLTYLGWAQDRQEIPEIRQRGKGLIAAAVAAAETYMQ